MAAVLKHWRSPKYPIYIQLYIHITNHHAQYQHFHVRSRKPRQATPILLVLAAPLLCMPMHTNTSQQKLKPVRMVEQKRCLLALLFFLGTTPSRYEMYFQCKMTRCTQSGL